MPITIKFAVEHPSESLVVDVMNMQNLMDKSTRCQFSTSTNIIKNQQILTCVVCDMVLTSS